MSAEEVHRATLAILAFKTADVMPSSRFWELVAMHSLA